MENQRMKEKGIKLFEAEKPKPLRRRKDSGDLLKTAKPLSSTASSANKGIAACKEESISARTSTKGVAALDTKLILANESIGTAEKFEKFKKLRLATKKSRRGEELTADEIDLLIQEELECKPHYEDEMEQEIEWSYLFDDVMFGSNPPQDVPSDGDSDSESLNWERIFEQINAPNSEEAGDSIGRSSVTDDKHVGIPSSNNDNSDLTATLNPAAVQSEDIRISREKGIKLFNAETPRPLKRRKVLGDLLKATKPLSSTASSANKGIAACKEESISAHTSTKGVAALDKKLILANESIGRAAKVEKFKKLRLATKKLRRGEELTADEIDLLIQEELECKPHYEDEMEQDIEFDGGSCLSDDVPFGSNSPQDVPSDGDSDSESLDWERIFERVNAPNSEEACGDIPSSKHEGCEG